MLMLVLYDGLTWETLYWTGLILLNDIAYSLPDVCGFLMLARGNGSVIQGSPVCGLRCPGHLFTVVYSCSLQNLSRVSCRSSQSVFPDSGGQAWSVCHTPFICYIMLNPSICCQS